MGREPRIYLSIKRKQTIALPSFIFISLLQFFIQAFYSAVSLKSVLSEYLCIWEPPVFRWSFHGAVTFTLSSDRRGSSLLWSRVSYDGEAAWGYCRSFLTLYSASGAFLTQNPCCPYREFRVHITHTDQQKDTKGKVSHRKFISSVALLLIRFFILCVYIPLIRKSRTEEHPALCEWQKRKE